MLLATGKHSNKHTADPNYTTFIRQNSVNTCKIKKKVTANGKNIRILECAIIKVLEKYHWF